MSEHRVFSMKFSSIYPLYLQKIEKKGRSEPELQTVLTWLTGYSDDELERMKSNDTTLKEFFDKAPRINPKSSDITGLICGYRIEEITDPLMQKIRWMDKLVDELAMGRDLKKVLRT